VVTVWSYQQQQIMAMVIGLVYGAAGEAGVWGFSGVVWLGFLLTAKLWGATGSLSPSSSDFFFNLSLDLDSVT